MFGLLRRSAAPQRVGQLQQLLFGTFKSQGEYDLASMNTLERLFDDLEAIGESNPAGYEVDLSVPIPFRLLPSNCVEWSFDSESW